MNQECILRIAVVLSNLKILQISFLLQNLSQNNNDENLLKAVLGGTVWPGWVEVAKQQFSMFLLPLGGAVSWNLEVLCFCYDVCTNMSSFYIQQCNVLMYAFPL